jgi:hypothetical protein
MTKQKIAPKGRRRPRGGVRASSSAGDQFSALQFSDSGESDDGSDDGSTTSAPNEEPLDPDFAEWAAHVSAKGADGAFQVGGSNSKASKSSSG